MVNRSFPIYKQADSMDCGPTCLRMVAKYYGKSFSLQYLRSKTKIGKDGVSLLGICEAAEEIGFRTIALKIGFQDLLQNAQFPVILHWDQRHFVVLISISGKNGRNVHFHIADPSVGLIKINESDFKHHWISDSQNGEKMGVALLLEPTRDFYVDKDGEGEESKHNLKEDTGKLKIANIFGYIKPYKRLLTQLVIGLVVGSILQLFLPFLAQSVVDTGINTGNIHFIYIVLLAQLALLTGRLAVEFVRGWLLLHISTRINISILTEFLMKIMRLPMNFFDTKHTGDILQRMSDHNRIESFLTGSSINIIFSFISLLTFSVALIIFDIRIFITFFIASFLYALWVLLFLKRRKRLDYRRFEISAKEQSATIQLIQGMQEIKLNGVERPMRWAWEGLKVKLLKISMAGLAINQWQRAGAFFINESKNLLITFFAAKSVINGQMTLGTMLAVQYIIGQLNSPIEQTIGFVQSWQNAKISMDRLNEVHGLEDEELESLQLQHHLPDAFVRSGAGENSNKTTDHLVRVQNTPSSFIIHGGTNYIPEKEILQYPSEFSINIHNLSFTYPGAGNEPVLKDINVQIPKGKTTAIVGVSGSGKTTLLKLLLKFYQPEKGDIKLGSTSLFNISHKVWRKHCGVVMQESYIFSDTIAKNIAVGSEKVNMEKLKNAAAVANIQGFIESLPLGYNTIIGGNGLGISVGQRQRILIARSIYKDPDFIFFDEATNSLDANNEIEIIRNLAAFFKGRTVLVVAHRLSTVKDADQIVVLNNGRISEKGTHQELTLLRGEYYQLVKNQLELGS